MRAIFTGDFEFLYWIARVITGEPGLAQRAMERVKHINESGRPPFRDWLFHWARMTVARASAREVQGPILAAASRYMSTACSHELHELLNAEQFATLGAIDISRFIAELDPLVRAMLVLRGILHCSIFECAIVLNTPARCANMAYCKALQWVKAQGVVLQ
jgi:DNA-directed RNA polymerase specialized sigma24 family protein